MSMIYGKPKLKAYFKELVNLPDCIPIILVEANAKDNIKAIISQYKDLLVNGDCRNSISISDNTNPIVEIDMKGFDSKKVNEFNRKIDEAKGLDELYQGLIVVKNYDRFYGCYGKMKRQDHPSEVVEIRKALSSLSRTCAMIVFVTKTYNKEERKKLLALLDINEEPLYFEYEELKLEDYVDCFMDNFGDDVSVDKRIIMTLLQSYNITSEESLNKLMSNIRGLMNDRTKPTIEEIVYLAVREEMVFECGAAKSQKAS